MALWICLWRPSTACRLWFTPLPRRELSADAHDESRTVSPNSKGHPKFSERSGGQPYKGPFNVLKFRLFSPKVFDPPTHPPLKIDLFFNQNTYIYHSKNTRVRSDPERVRSGPDSGSQGARPIPGWCDPEFWVRTFWPGNGSFLSDPEKWFSGSNTTDPDSESKYFWPGNKVSGSVLFWPGPRVTH